MDNTHDPATAKRIRNFQVAFVATTLVLMVAVGFLYAKVRELQSFRRNFPFTMFSLSYQRDEDLLTPQVGTIQFLKRGYSVAFDTVEYTSNGLVLKGRIGNPFNLWVSSLTLRFDARPSIFTLEDKWHQSREWAWNEGWNIGSAQTSVGVLAPRTTTPFQVTIPNVKQTAATVEIAVLFMGERYNYDDK